MALTQVTSNILAATTGSGTTVVLSTSPTITTPTISGSLTASSSGITFSDSSVQTAAASPYVLKNRIINGAMEIDQRNAGAAVNLTATTGIYTVDRWFGYANNTASGTLTAQQISSSYPYTLRVARTSGTYTGGLTVGQVIESKNMLDLAGKTVTLSFQLAKGSSYTASTVQVYIWSGTVADQGMSGIFNGNWTGIAAANTLITPTTTATTYTVSYAVPSNAKELAISFVTGSFAGTGSANDYFEISNVQLEIGTSATPFERRLYNQELANCQRYYEKSFDIAVAPVNGTSTTFGDYNGLNSWVATNRLSTGTTTYFKVVKRATPTMTNYGNSSGYWGYLLPSGSSYTWSAPLSPNRTNQNSFTADQQVVDGALIFISGHWTASAEL